MTLRAGPRPAKFNFDFAFLLLVLAGLNVPFWTIRSLPSGDTISAAEFFQFFYREWLFNHELPRWMPYNLYGIQPDFWTITSLSPAQYFVAFVARIFSAHNTLRLFEVSIVIEEVALLVGTYLLSRRLFQHRLTTVFICLGVMGTVVWPIQIWFNFRIYYLLPLVFYFLIRFFDTSDFRQIWIAGIITIVSLIGNLPYFAPLYAVVLAIFFLMLLVGRWRSLRGAIASLFRASSAIWFVIFWCCAFLYLRYAFHALDHTIGYPMDRDPTTM